MTEKRIITQFHPFSVLITKTGLTLSILYFIIAFIFQSTMQHSTDVIWVVTNVDNFIKLGTMNFFLYILLGVIFNYKLQR